MDNDPVNKIDPTGAGTESVHVDPKGNVLQNYDDGDNSVYVHAAAITAKDVDNTHTETDHSAGGLKIGELGGNIDIIGIAANLLKDDKAVAQIINNDEWVAKVLPNQVWDLKNNKATIFGVAWAFDAKAQQEAPAGTTVKHTSFNEFQDAAAFGNYHAGYTGVHADVSRTTQYTLAGLGEVAKFHGDNTRRLTEIKYGIPPYGDQPIDYKYNTQGMNAADSEIKRNGRPVRPVHANPIRRSGSYNPYN